MGRRKARLALTVGDPGGVGPEIFAKLLDRGTLPEIAEFVVIGAADALLREAPALEERYGVVVDNAAEGIEERRFPLIVDTGSGEPVPTGKPTVEGGRISARSIEVAVELAKSKKIDGIVTGPVSKEALGMAGYRYTGHTEMLAALFCAPDCQMMMVAGDFKVLILTRHLPLREVAGKLSRERIVTAIRVAGDALERDFGVERPRIAVAALNPHAGDGGLIGDEDERVVAPAVSELREAGLNVEGPFPADSLFHSQRRRGYDALVALYHDQGMIPFKMEAFDRGVNVTVGLPVIRTSVCHGTAYDIAGRSMADVGSLEAAVELAVECCERRIASD
ncbi:MAG: 4-hydroxythreonine-4-phosphate dehydrogenase PdxA [Candidatus Krumholzibacteria bacterium]|nr:4-hydroxythreonine-4-phosphate dehydrogenase PdxA [Candidatus Krumholzibacteria bacterium]